MSYLDDQLSMLQAVIDNNMQTHIITETEWHGANRRLAMLRAALKFLDEKSTLSVSLALRVAVEDALGPMLGDALSGYQGIYESHLREIQEKLPRVTDATVAAELGVNPKTLARRRAYLSKLDGESVQMGRPRKSRQTVST